MAYARVKIGGFVSSLLRLFRLLSDINVAVSRDFFAFFKISFIQPSRPNISRLKGFSEKFDLAEIFAF